MIDELTKVFDGTYTQDEWNKIFERFKLSFAGQLPSPSTSGLSFIDALSLCLQKTKMAEPCGVRPVGFKGLAYGWQSDDGQMWELNYVDSEREQCDESVYFGYFEILSVAKIIGEWSI